MSGDALEDLVRQVSPPFLSLISRELRTSYDGVANEPLPERWVDLINRLNERERKHKIQDQKGEHSRQAPRRQVH